MAHDECRAGCGDAGSVDRPAPPCIQIGVGLADDRSAKRSLADDAGQCCTPPCVPIRPNNAMMSIPSAPHRETIIARPKHDIDTTRFTFQDFQDMQPNGP